MTIPRLTILGGLTIILVSIASGWPLLRNDFAQDDVPLAEEDLRIQSLGNIREILTTPFWPKAGTMGHHRPAMTLSLALEWAAGKGRPVAFKIISLTLATAAALAVFALALELMPLGWAWAAALGFAVHPVHVEAIAVAINQGELIIAMMYALTLRWYLRYRRIRATRWRDRMVMAGLMMLALFYKETGIVLPALLVAAELCFAHGRSIRERWNDLRPTILLQVLVVAVVLAIRTAVVGDMRGTFTAEALGELTMWQRGLTMLGVVPEYLRLLFFPAALQADYSPGEIVAATSFGAPQLLGSAIIVLALVLLIRSGRDTPALTFAGLWMIIGIGPVSNVVVPSGIALAERTLYLPSVGAMLLLGVVCAASTSLAIAHRRRRLVTSLLGATALLLIFLGASRSHSRFGVWRDQRTLWTQTVIDAPFSYRAYLALGTILLDEPAFRDMAIRFLERGVAEFENPVALFGLSQLLLGKSDCVHALPVARRALELRELPSGRSEYLTCLTWEGRYDEAHVEALQGIRSGMWTPVFLRWARWLDTVRVNSPPPHTVASPDNLSDLFTTEEEEPGVGKLHPAMPPPGPPWSGR